jgi:hypothetical protein
MNAYVYLAFERKAPPGTVAGWDPISLMHVWGLSTSAIEFLFLGFPLLLFVAGWALAYRRFTRRQLRA